MGWLSYWRCIVILPQTNGINKQTGGSGSCHPLYLQSVLTDCLRPLPKEMLAYARSDTHFLLFIYDNLRNALLDRASTRSQSRTLEYPQQQASISSSNPDSRDSLLREVLLRSEETSLRLHQTESYDEEEGTGPGGWDTMARKWNKVPFTRAARRSIQKNIYLRIHDWRDRMAREEDESTAYVFHAGPLPFLLLMWDPDTFYRNTTCSNLRNSHQMTFPGS